MFVLVAIYLNVLHLQIFFSVISGPTIPLVNWKQSTLTVDTPAFDFPLNSWGPISEELTLFDLKKLINFF